MMWWVGGRWTEVEGVEGGGGARVLAGTVIVHTIGTVVT